ncbi:MAG: ATP-binding protein [Verrucomicrobiia bacterium]
MVAILAGLAWRNAWLQETAERINLTGQMLADSIELRFGSAPTPEELVLTETQLQTVLHITPGLLGLTIALHQPDSVKALVSVGQPPPSLPASPKAFPTHPLEHLHPDRLSIASAPIGPPNKDQTIRLWMLVKPELFRPSLFPQLAIAGTTLAAALALVVGWWLLKSLSSPLPPWLHHAKDHADAFLIAGVILLASLAASLTIFTHQKHHISNDFFTIATPIQRQIIETTVNITSIGTESIAAFFLASQEVNAQDFSTFTEHLKTYPGVDAWFWLKPVFPQTLDTTLAQIRERDNLPNFNPWRLDQLPAPGPGSLPEGALMVEFVEPRQENQKILGFIFESEATRLNLASWALRRRAPTATTLLQLAHRPLSEPRLALLHPVFLPDGSLLGCASAIVRPDAILKNALGNDDQVIIDWFEVQPDSPPTFLAGSSNSSAAPPASAQGFYRPFFAFGNTYLLHARPGPDFHRATIYPSALILLGGGLVLACTSWWIASSEARFRSQLQETVQRRTAELLATQARYADLARRNRTFVWECDANGLYQFLDPVVEEVIGYRPEELIGKVHLWDLHPEDGREELRLDVLRHFSEKLPATNYENRVITKDGRLIWLSSSGGPLLDPQGNFIGYRGWDTDITHEKERELLRTRAQRLESLGILSGGIAHDLNNALGPILMSADLLRLDESDPEKKRLLRAILDSAQRAADMVRQVLLFARGSEGRKIPLNPRQLIADIASLIHDTFPKNIQLQVDIDPAPIPSILGDPTQLHQVLLNLCINARDAMPSGGTLRLGLKSLPPLKKDTPPEVLLTVSDTGHGMTPEVQARAFDPFFTTKEVGRGTGLGLSTSHTIIRNHGGRIHLTSAPELGTQFTVYLPSIPEPTSPPNPAPPPQLSGGRGETILVIDDDHRLRETTCHVLRSAGFQPLPATDGHHAIEIFRHASDPIRAAVVDLHMPNLGGPEAIRSLRQLNPQLPILATSGSGNHAEVERESGCTIQGFLNKPYRTRDLLRLLRTALDHS